jgi:hypothetical protein
MSGCHVRHRALCHRGRRVCVSSDNELTAAGARASRPLELGRRRVGDQPGSFEPISRNTADLRA